LNLASDLLRPPEDLETHLDFVLEAAELGCEGVVVLPEEGKELLLLWEDRMKTGREDGPHFHDPFNDARVDESDLDGRGVKRDIAHHGGEVPIPDERNRPSSWARNIGGKKQPGVYDPVDVKAFHLYRSDEFRG
jgi:hypothetical protein